MSLSHSIGCNPQGMYPEPGSPPELFKVLRSKKSSAEKRARANYMLAYLSMESDKDPHVAAIRAGKHLKELNYDRFNPADHHLPGLSGDQLFAIAEADHESAVQLLSNPNFEDCLSGEHLCRLGQDSVEIARIILEQPTTSEKLTGDQLCQLGQKSVDNAAFILRQKTLSNRLDEMALFMLVKDVPDAFQLARAASSDSQEGDKGTLIPSFAVAAPAA